MLERRPPASRFKTSIFRLSHPIPNSPDVTSMWTRWLNLRRAFHSVALFSPSLCGRRAGATRSLPASDAGGTPSGPKSLDRKGVGEGKGVEGRVGFGGRRITKKKK